MQIDRILIKISGESFLDKTSNFNFKYLKSLVDQIIYLKNKNKEIIIVVGGGNICRGNELKKNFSKNLIVDPLHYASMMATVINGIILKEIFRDKGHIVGLLNAFKIETIYTEKYSFKKANEILKENKILILTGGKGKPGFSTDILVTEKSKELNVKLILLGKNDVNGIFSLDPKVDKNANFFSKISFKKILEMNIKIMDLNAVKLGIDIKDLEMIVFNIKSENSILNAFKRKGKYTYVTNYYE